MINTMLDKNNCSHTDVVQKLFLVLEHRKLSNIYPIVRPKGIKLKCSKQRCSGGDYCDLCDCACDCACDCPSDCNCNCDCYGDCGSPGDC